MYCVHKVKLFQASSIPMGPMVVFFPSEKQNVNPLDKGNKKREKKKQFQEKTMLRRNIYRLYSSTSAVKPNKRVNPRKKVNKNEREVKISSVLSPVEEPSPNVARLDKQLSTLDNLLSEINLRIAEQKEQLSTEEEEMQRQFGVALPRQYADLVGSVDADCPPSRYPCVGCGAPIHCCSPHQPGFISSFKFKALNSIQMQNCKCLRCKGLEYHNVLLDAKVTPEQYRSVLADTRHERSAMVHVVDITDYQNSFIPDLLDIVGHNHPVYVVANKIDLIPKDSPGYLRHIEDCVTEHAKYLYGRRLKRVSVVSALTGYGIEELVTTLLNHVVDKQTGFHLVGCTNAGKSSLFNSLLLSDLCKISARGQISPATTSLWPGTTLNLLKFPVNRPSRYMIAMRLQRLREQESDESHPEEPDKTRNKATTTLRGLVETTSPDIDSGSAESDEYSQTELNSQYKVKSSLLKDQTDVLRPSTTFDYRAFAESRWLHDTPGLVNHEQLINQLDMTDLRRLLMKRMTLPRTFSLRVGLSMLIGGIGRLDFVKSTQCQDPVLLTVIVAAGLPVHCMPTEEVEERYKQLHDHNQLLVPSQDSDLTKIAALRGHTMEVECVGLGKSEADIQLSSIGWVGVAGERDTMVTIKAYTPGGVGIHTRRSLLPYAVLQKGHRKRGSRSYKMKPPMRQH